MLTTTTPKPPPHTPDTGGAHPTPTRHRRPMGLDGSHNAPQQQQQQQPGHNQQQPCLLPRSPLDSPTDAVPPAYGFTSTAAAAAAAAIAESAAHIAAARSLAGTEGGVRCVRDEIA
jgi:hypothetical protein